MTHLRIIGALAAFALIATPALAQSDPEMDHSKMDHSEMDHSKMDHSSHADMATDDVEAAAPVAADAAMITAKVNGLVCDFCAQSLRKVFAKEDAVDSIAVDLDAGEVRIALKTGKSLDDATIKKLIRKSGYSLVSIDRANAA